MSTDPPFLTDLLSQLQQFALTHRVPPEDVVVRLTLADGSSFRLACLAETPASGPHRWGMLHLAEKERAKAIAVRESHILKAEFDLAPVVRKPIGFQAETDP